MTDSINLLQNAINKSIFFDSVKNLNNKVEKKLDIRFKLVDFVYCQNDVEIRKFGVCNIYSLEIEYSVKHHFKAVNFKFYHLHNEKIVYVVPYIKYTREILETTVINDFHYSINEFNTSIASNYIQNSLEIIFQLSNK